MEQRLRMRFRESIQTRIIHQSNDFFSYLLETSTGEPTPNYIARGAYYVLKKSDIIPCRMQIFLGLILRKETQYRFFFPGAQTEIAGVLRIMRIENDTLDKIEKNIKQDNYLERLRYYRGNMNSQWKYVSICCIMYRIVRVK